ncbi:GNAT family N-acetyltransferase [Desulfosporosinus meridiei]|uniref:Acetyltransferase n=1 Tax=Desulfosporosinus meridiei (strain ATCC BAA-275 / DSM 13257 / KCTC 12902 / NCIMB 13706 / S10) TaxID=768704 RepID=J7IQ03_DESMD|nr:GNAT family N-acetyltransferase [Desulfosporosinus meridiei]AFQ42244.1 acetyltransferase [Desulfosporosinus meridiei DSM 13257]
MIEYKRVKEFTEEQLEDLFLSVDWFSGKFPAKLRTAFQNSSKVVSAWDDIKLVGLIRGLDDGVWQATIDCLLVNPQYQGYGIASTLVNSLLQDYKDFLYVEVVPDEKKNVSFYQKQGFEIMAEGTPLQFKGCGWK